MSHGIELESDRAAPTPLSPGVRRMMHVLDRINMVAMRVSMAAMVVTSLILTMSVVTRYFLNAPTDWQDEASVFMLVGVTFFCAAHVQACRGHIGIEAIASLLPPAVNAVRHFVVDVASLLFCTFFSWKSWALCQEAWVDGQTTSSTLAPPLWIPYSMMALGMSLLTVQILVQVLSHLTKKGPPQ